MTKEMPQVLRDLLAQITGMSPQELDGADIGIKVIGPGGLEELKEALEGRQDEEEFGKPILLNDEQLAYFTRVMGTLRSASIEGSAEGDPDRVPYNQRIIEMLSVLEYQIRQDRDVLSHMAAITAILGATLAMMNVLVGKDRSEMEQKHTDLMANVIRSSFSLAKGFPRYDGAKLSEENINGR